MPTTQQSLAWYSEHSAFARTCSLLHGSIPPLPYPPPSFLSLKFSATFPCVRSQPAPSAILERMHGLFSTLSLVCERWVYGVWKVRHVFCKDGRLCSEVRSLN